MTDRWPNVRLAEVLTLSPEPHDVLVDAEYPNVGMYSYARGLFLKRPIAGSATSAKVLFRVKKDQFIYSRLFAFEGAYGVVPAQFDGTFVSNEYPTFDVDRSRLLPHFLELYFKQPTVWEAVAKASTGVGHRRQRVPPSGVLSATIPLPPLSVQQAAVSRVEAIAGRIEEAKRLRGESKAATEALLESAISARLEELSSCTTAPLAELTTKVGSGSTPAGGRAAYPGSGIPFIRSMNVRMRRFQYNDLVYISADTHRTMSGTRVQPLDAWPTHRFR
jgi:type I restriction enzyme S subunit